MASEREDNKLQSLADRLRGTAASVARDTGKQLSQQAVGKAETVKEIGSPAATPKLSQGQTEPARQRSVTEKKQNQIGSPGGAPEQKPAQEKLAEVAKGLRESGVTGGRAANDVAPAKNTPAVEQKQSRGRGR